MNTEKIISLEPYTTRRTVTETLDACQSLQILLGRLRRRGLLSDAEWRESLCDLGDIQSRVQKTLEGDGPLAA